MTSSEIPEYRVLTDTFFAPKMVLAGSVIATRAKPGPHLLPINDSAKEVMEAWYQEEHPTRDKDGTLNTEKTWKPHERFRVGPSGEPGETHLVEVLSEPSKDATGELSLAESTYARRDTDQRPGPDKLYAGRVPSGDVAEAIAVQSGAVIVTEETTPSDSRIAGIKVK